MQHALSRIRGYTLIELAVALPIIGIMLITLITSVHLYNKTRTHQTTLNNISAISAALNTYLMQTGAYPCPAAIDLPRSDPQYGIAGDCTDVSVRAGSCGGGNGNGYCVQQSDRQLSATKPPGWNGRVRRGAVPFRTLGIPEYDAVDAYNDRLVYAVTEALAVPATYNPQGGAIDMQDGTGNPLVKPLPGNTGGTTHYVIISYGPDKAGAHNFESGALIKPCPALGSTLDAGNCQISDLKADTPLPPAIYYAAGYADVSGAQHFDDTVFYYSAVQTPMWQVAGALGLDITDPVQAGDDPAAGKIGIGVNPGTSGLSAALQVNGNVHASNNIDANQLCGSGNQVNCAAAAPLTSACPKGQVATGFNAGHVSCVKDLQVVCPAGELMTGISAGGNITCQTAAGCPKTSVQTCWNAANDSYNNTLIPSAPLNNVYVTPVSGDSYRQTFQCLISGNSAQWVKTGASGTCLCTPAHNAPVTESCFQYKEDNCPDCWTGVANFTQNVTCPGGETSQAYVSDTCLCHPHTLTYSRPCAGGLSGSTIYTQDYMCDPTDPHAAGTWGSVTQAGSCICNPQTITRTITCQSAGYTAGYMGSVTQTSQTQCPSGTAGYWRTTGDSCACTNLVQYQTIGCPGGQAGTQNQSQTFNCTTNSWESWVTNSSTCGTGSHIWQAISNPIGPVTAPLGALMGSACSTQGDVAPCAASAGSKGWWGYSACECE